MIADLKPYPEYRDSGSPWIGVLPSHWQLPRLGSVLRERGETNEARQVHQVLSVMKDIGVIPYEEKGNVGNKRSEDIARYKVVKPDDIVINCMNVIIGSVGISRYTGCLSPVYYVLTRRSISDNPQYLNAVFQTKPFQQSLVRIGNGILAHRMRIPMELLKCEPFPIPPLDEQSAIVRFLGYANIRLEKAIRAKLKIITLLNEQKQVIIHRAVTRGLDPNVRLKDSGIPWLGEIPEHWEVRRLRTLVRKIDQGVSPQADGFLADCWSWGVLKSGCVNHGIFRETEHKRLAKDFEIDPSIVVKLGDVLVSRACGSPRLVGSVGKVDELNYRLILSDKTFRLAFRDFVDVDFAVYAMNNRYYREQVEQAISGAEGLASNLPLSALRSFLFAVPPQEEAQMISSYLCESLGGISRNITHAEQEITLLREYRTRLIADVVTGKLDVREVAGHLPDESDVLAPISYDSADYEDSEMDGLDKEESSE